MIKKMDLLLNDYSITFLSKYKDNKQFAAISFKKNLIDYFEEKVIEEKDRLFNNPELSAVRSSYSIPKDKFIIRISEVEKDLSLLLKSRSVSSTCLFSISMYADQIKDLHKILSIERIDIWVFKQMAQISLTAHEDREIHILFSYEDLNERKVQGTFLDIKYEWEANSEKS